jgi:hypothetical protein
MSITVIVAIFAAAILVGCLEKDVAAPITNIKKDVAVPITNSEFQNISADALHNIAYQFKDIERAKDEGDFVTAKTHLTFFDESVNQYITEYEEMTVLQNTLPCKKAVINVFEECKLVGVYYNTYLENPSVTAFVRYNLQARNVTNQMEIVDMLAESL